MNLMMLLEMATEGFGDRIAIQSQDAKLSYSELFAAAGAAAHAVAASGAERLAVLDVNSLAVPVGLFAAAWVGVPFVPLNYRLTGKELEALLASIAPAYLVTDTDRAGALAATVRTVVDREGFLAAARGGADRPGEWSMDADAIGILLFTSGTTGAPKAAVLRQKHLVSYIFGSIEFGAADASDAALVSVPPYHIAGMAAILSSVYSGRRIVQLSSFDAAGWVETARRERVTHAFVVPTMLTRIVDVLAREGLTLPHLRAVSYGGGKMPQPVIERAMALLPEAAFTNAYGLTETSSTITVLGPEDHRAAAASADPAVRRRLVSVGRALPSIELEVRDEEGRPCPAGVSGEIHVRGEQVSGEYLGLASRLTRDGWFPTRDAGTLDAEGYLFLEGRIDDVIVRGGENLSPGEIEEVLLAHPAIADCGVVGVPDEQWGEAVAAVIVTHPDRTVTPDEVREFVKQRLRSSRAPARVEFRRELPYNETGKLLRRKLREELARTVA
ncbi:MAG: AMP-dependent synthetase [Polyangiaceae bacterium UTPRO1]|jgi:acyl-CoA synthetase (AMP-forming)/AMP-acid ligase II|nr:AMP-binding protein [Myxococcales bacterium]OQY67041.1 MAG: AMP-dependent synthetase [Polyangiaceae bacterium UTPRO1]